MKLPNPEQAIIPEVKLSGYCLNPEHEEGGSDKARVFRSALGLGQENADELKSALIQAAQNYDAFVEKETEYGIKYILFFPMNRGEKQATIKSVWIVRHGEDFPRLVSCYVAKNK
jgi:hypothetical protein